MYQIIDTINNATFDGLKVTKLTELNATEMLQINLEKDAVFPEHASPTDATLLVLEGTILFHITDHKYQLSSHQLFKFPKNIPHRVLALEDSKFLILR